jgi:hypothetical protein
MASIMITSLQGMLTKDSQCSGVGEGQNALSRVPAVGGVDLQLDPSQHQGIGNRWAHPQKHIKATLKDSKAHLPTHRAGMLKMDSA